MHEQFNNNNEESSDNNSEVKKISKIRNRANYNFLVFFTFMIGVLLIFYSYAWFYASLNVKVKFLNLVVTNENGLSISFDGVNFSQSIEISKKMLTEELKKTYPNNTSQWANLGLRPVSTNGIVNSNSSKFKIFMNEGFTYKDKKREFAYLNASEIEENKINASNYYIAFDLFLKNVTGSPISDNLYLNNDTGVYMESTSEEVDGLINSLRFGFIKIGSVPLGSPINSIQNVQCNNQCQMIMYEPNSTKHTNLSIDRAKAYSIKLTDGRYFPTYAVVKDVKEMDIRDGIFGGSLNKDIFSLQHTITDFKKPLFTIPDGISKIRVYIWIEGQDIDSLETRSDGADISIKIDFIKDTAGFDYYN